MSARGKDSIAKVVNQRGFDSVPASTASWRRCLVRLAEPLQSGLEPFPGCRLGQRLGHGGFGEVWQASARDGTSIALKFLPCDNSQDVITELRSLQAIRELQHP